MDSKRTKIVATISDKNCEPGFIRELYEAGMNVIRINSAHLDIEGALRIIKNTREVSDKIAILLDTKGPEIRTTICDAPIPLKKGATINIIGDPGKKSSPEAIYVSYESFSSDIPLGSLILMDDGELELRVSRKNGSALICTIENDGVLGSRKSVNIPSVKITLPSLTDKCNVMSASCSVSYGKVSRRNIAGYGYFGLPIKTVASPTNSFNWR